MGLSVLIPSPETVAPSVAVPPEPVVPSTTRSNVDAKLDTDADFAQRYLAGEISDSFGNKIDGSNGITALGPHPDQIPGYAPESRRDLRYQPIRFHAPARRAVARKSGYGVTRDDLDAEKTALAAQRFR